ncbi:hypothetical protein [Streptomyces sp. NPDC007991]
MASKQGVRCGWAIAYGGVQRRPDDTTSMASRGSAESAQAPDQI